MYQQTVRVVLQARKDPEMEVRRAATDVLQTMKIKSKTKIDVPEN